MEDKFTLELTKDELLAVREAVKTYEGPGYICRPLSHVYEMAWKAYKKPQISPEEYKKRMDAVKEKYKNHINQGYMILEEKRKIKFYYELPEEVPG